MATANSVTMNKHIEPIHGGKAHMIAEVTRARDTLVFPWPEGTEQYGPVIEVQVSGATYARPFKLHTAYGYRKAFGALRRRILVYRSESDVLAEFVGVDNWAQDKRVATFIRREGSKKLLRLGDAIPPRYQPFSVVHSKSIITGPYAPDCFAVVVDEADLPSLVAVALSRDAGECAAEAQMSGEPGATVEIVGEHLQPGQDHARTVVQALLAYRAQQKTGGPFTKSKEADEFLRQNPFAFVLAASIDRGALAENIWEVPFLLRNLLGHLDPRRLSHMTNDGLEAVLRSLNKRPRYPRQAAQTILSLSKLVVDQFAANAASMWENKAPREVVRILQQVWGVGPGIAHMTVRILVDEFRYDPGPKGLQQIDVKPDRQLVRVFHRTGLIRERNENASVKVARELHPEFPGLLDWPAWEIGRSWCDENDPACAHCPLGAVCSAIDVGAHHV